MQIEQNARLSVAPMMDWTDRHCRYFHRLMTRHTLLYTEMVTAPALVRGDARHLLRFDPAEHPVALQLGGSDPQELAQAAEMGQAEGYDEINLNVGCPSDRVQSGTFGAVLMKTPGLVADCVRAMRRAVDVPVTVARVLPDFIAQMVDAGVDRMAIHARKAWLKGLSPKENREIPPLDYDLVHDMKARFPAVHVSINGGIDTLEAARSHLEGGLDGAMIGRAAYHSPWDVLGQADTLWGASPPYSNPEEVALAMVPYIQSHLDEGGRLHAVTRHMLGLFQGRPGARGWRRTLSEGAARKDAGSDLLLEAISHLKNTQAA